MHLTLPKESLFTEKTDPAKASVVIRLKPGRVFAPQHVNAITHLMARAVPGLQPEHVAGVIMETYQGVGPDFAPV